MTRWGPLGLLLAFCLLAAIYSLATPLFEAPDEPWHYAYVRWLAEGHGLPRLDDNASGANQEVAQPPLYYAVAALVSGPVDDGDLPALFWHNPQFGYQAGGTVNDNKNMLIHTEREQFPWRGAVLAVRLARWVSLAFGLLTVAASYGLAREALPDRPTMAVVVAGIVAFTPQFLFMSGVVSNDSASAATSTLALWALARIVRRGPTPRRATAAGLALGLALLSKTSTLLLLPMAALAWWMGNKQTNQPTNQPTNQLTLLLLLSLPTLIGGWWYVRNGLLFGDPLGLGIHTDTPWGRPAPVGLFDLVRELPQVFRSFWGAFGWGHVELPGPLYLALGGLVVLALVGWARRLVRLRRAWPWSRSLVATGTVFALCALWCLVVLAALLRWMQQVQAPHGRLLFPALGAWGLLLAAGWAGLSSNGGGSLANRLGLLVPVACLLLLSAVVPWAIIRPAFAQPTLTSPQAATQNITPHTLDYAGRARLLGYRVEPAAVKAGERIELTLCWETLAPMEQDYLLFIHLLGRDNLRVAERTSYPGQGRYPTSLWPVGRAFCDAYRLEVAPWAPAPELYAIEVGLYDVGRERPLPAQNAAGQAVDPPNVGLIRVTPATPPPSPTHKLSYRLGEQIALVGYDELALKAGDTLTLTLYWQVLGAPEGDYKVFVHLLDEKGELVVQDDAPPRSGRYPTWAWQTGDLVPDPHRLQLPQERPPGPYHWSVGMYLPSTADRLPITGPEGRLPDDVIRIETSQRAISPLESR